MTAFALAVSEENATGGKIVTAPTCGSCGVVPAVLRYFQKKMDITEDNILRALARLMVIITKIIESIMSDIIMLIT